MTPVENDVCNSNNLSQNGKEKIFFMESNYYHKFLNRFDKNKFIILRNPKLFWIFKKVEKRFVEKEISSYIGKMCPKFLLEEI